MSSSSEKLKQADFRLCADCNRLHTNLTTCPNCQSPLTLVDYTFFLGKSLGKYEIKEILGIGGMGIVFKAVHEILQKDVAVKIFISSSDDSTFEQRFIREARILAGLKHPNIIEVYDFDISDWGMPFYVMEYLEGKTLGELIRERGAGLPLDQISRFADPVIQGLSYAHKKGIVHRDLKPDNIFIEEVNNRMILKILDFGIAKSLIANENAPSLTATETVLGTPFYLTPEQILNKNIGPHTDQYALALIIGEILSGQVIRDGKSVGEILYKEVHNPIEVQALKKKNIPAPVAEVLVTATMPRPEKRFRDIDGFGTALFKAISKSTPIAGQKTMVQKDSKRNQESKKTFLSIEEEALLLENKKRKAKVFSALAAVTVFVIVIVSILYIVLGSKKDGIDPELPVDKVAKNKSTKKKANNAAKKAKLIVSRPGQIITVPQEVKSILSFGSGTMVLEGSEGIFQVNLKKTQNPERIPLTEKILTGLSRGDIAFIDNYTINIRNFIDGSDRVVLRKPPRYDWMQLSPSEKFLAVKMRSLITLYHVKNKKFTKTRTIKVGKSVSTHNSVLSDNYFTFVDDDRLQVCFLRSSRSTVRIPGFNEPGLAVETMVIHDSAGLLAVGGKFAKVYIFDIANNSLVQAISLQASTLAFSSGTKTSPVLAIAQKDKILYWKRGKGITGHLITTDAYVKNILISQNKVMALDRKVGKIFLFNLD